MAGNFILASAKTILSVLSGSAALIADALHSFSDLLVSLLVLAGLKFNRKKIEAAVTFIVGIIIISVAIGFAVELFFKEQVMIKNIIWAVSGQIIIITATYILYKYKSVIGTEEKSESLIADGAHTKSDMLSSIGVLISLSGYLIGLNLDKAAAFIIFFLILYQGLETLISAVYMFRGSEITHYDLMKKIRAILISVKKKKRRSIPALFFVLLIIYVFPGLFTVPQNYRGIRTVLGITKKKQIQPGLHFDPLYLLSDIETFNTSEIKTMEYGFRYRDITADDIIINQIESIHNSKKYMVISNEEDLLTGDGSLTKVHLIIEYRISDPYDYLTNTENPGQFLRIEIGTQLQKITGSLTLFDVLNKKREIIEYKMKEKLNRAMTDFNTGLSVENVILYSITPHTQTVYMFREVQNAEQNRKTLLYEAEAAKARQLPYYRGLAYEKIVNAEAMANEIIVKAERESAQYRMLEREFRINPEAVKLRLEMDSRIKLLKDTEKILIEKNLGDDLIRLNRGERE